jgi:SAM-dependent methyltransferase
MDMNIPIPTLMNLRLPAGVEKLDKIIEGYQSFQILLAALNLGLFDIVDQKGPGDRNQIAEWIGINGMFARAFLDSLVDMGLMNQRGEKYSNSKTANDFLLRRSPFFQSDWVKNVVQGGHWKDLTASLKVDQAPKDNFNAGPSPAFIDALGQRALRGELQAVTEAIANWDGFDTAGKVLDLGGGHGLYAIALCQDNPRLEGVIYDKPHIMETTARYIDDYGMSERLEVMSGDICTDSLGKDYDIVIISHLLYKFRNDLGSIFDKVIDSLNPGGLLVTNHWFCAPGCAPESDGVQELAKALQSFGHPLCHVEDFDNLFRLKGFSLLSTSEVPTAFGSSRLSLAVKSEPSSPFPIHTSSSCRG